MHVMVFAAADNIYRSCECIHGFTFKTAAPRDNYVPLTGSFAQLQDRSVCLTILNASHRECTGE